MAHLPEVTNMALFCDFENIALGVQEMKYESSTSARCWAPPLKGSIVVKKAYTTGTATRRSGADARRPSS
jgi:hypothetical protein